MIQSSYRIMLVEDDHKLAGLLSDELKRHGYTVDMIQDFGRVKDTFLAIKPDLVLLDINLPRFDGYTWCRHIRTISKVPIIFISARSGDLDQVRALENGADDYITKPFNMELVLAKVGSTMRRVYGEYALNSNTEVVRIGDLFLYQTQNRVVYGEDEVELAPKEFRLLLRLAESAGDIVSREDLLEALWDDIDFVDDNTLTVNVTRVRRRLAELGLPDAIETKRGQGYRLNIGKEH